MYQRLSDPALKAAVTQDTNARFHACERYDRCSVANADQTKLVYINPVVMSSEKWTKYLKETSNRLSFGFFPSSLVRDDFAETASLSHALIVGSARETFALG